MANNNFNPAVQLKDFSDLLTDLNHAIQFAKHLGKKTGVIYIKTKAALTNDQLQHLFNQDNPNTAFYKIKHDEYCLLIKKFEKTEQVAEIAKRISYALHHIKIGVALYPYDNDKTEVLVNLAREACLANEKNSLDFCKKDIDSQVKQKLRLEKDIHVALINHELLLHYQPIINLTNNQIASAEALLRWNHPEFGLLNPLDFVPIIEEQDLMIDFGEWIFETAFYDYKKWLRTNQFTISINVAPTQILSHFFVNRMTHRIEQSSLAWENVQIELTENDYIHDIEESSKKLRELSRKGLKIILDDYGTGFSSMKYLLNLPINNIKIDKSYIKDIESNNHSRQIVKSTIQMAHELGLTVTAEGIETTGQVDILKSLGCDYGQGYLFSKPLSHEAFKDLIKKWRERR